MSFFEKSDPFHMLKILIDFAGGKKRLVFFGKIHFSKETDINKMYKQSGKSHRKVAKLKEELTYLCHYDHNNVNIDSCAATVLLFLTKSERYL